MATERKPLTSEQKDKIGNWLSLAVCIMGVLLGYGFLVGSNFMMWTIAVVNLVFGPACFVFYLIEVRKGIFSRDDEE